MKRLLYILVFFSLTSYGQRANPGSGGGADGYIETVTLSNDSLIFDGVLNAFTGSVLLDAESYISNVSSPGTSNNLTFTGVNDAFSGTLANIAKTNYAQSFNVTAISYALTLINNSASGTGLLIRHGSTSNSNNGLLIEDGSLNDLFSVRCGGDIYMNELSTATTTEMLYRDPTTKKITVGALPSGSGTVTSVAAGNGMDFTTITTTGSVTMGTPSTINSTSTNSVTTTSHTHEIDEVALLNAINNFSFNSNVTAIMNVTNSNSLGGAINASGGLYDYTGSGTGIVNLKENNTPGSVTAGYGFYYVDTDHKAKFKDQDETVYDLTQGYSIRSGAPSSSSDVGEAGEIRYDSSYIYICIATDTWKRVLISTW